VAVLWGVFSNLFSGAKFGAPYPVYLFAGIVVYGSATQTIQQTAASLVSNESMISKVLVPPELFPIAAACSVAIISVVTLLPLLALQIILGAGVPPTAPLAVLPLILVGAFGLGVGMLIARIAVGLPDALHVTNVGLLLLGYLTPTFYPLSQVSGRARWVILANPLTEDLSILRSVVYGDAFGTWHAWLYAIATGAVVLVLGIRSFGRGARYLVVMK
jgi:ABC-type polysaccharide/polyol phosphate export permease